MDTKVVRKDKPYYLSFTDYSNWRTVIEKVLRKLDMDIYKYNIYDTYYKYQWVVGCSIQKSEYPLLPKAIADFHKALNDIKCDDILLQRITHQPNIEQTTINLMISNLNYTFKQEKSLINNILFSLNKVRTSLSYNYKKQIIHGDLHLNNMIINNTDIVFIDMIDIHYDYRIIDVVWLLLFTFIWDAQHFTIMDNIHYDNMMKFLAMYDAFNPLEYSEKKDLADIVSVLMIYSLFTNHSLWRKRRIDSIFYSNIEKINMILMEDSKLWNTLSSW